MSRTSLLVDGQPETLVAGSGSCSCDGLSAAVDIADLGDGQYSVTLDARQYVVRLAALGNSRYRAAVLGATLDIEVVDPRSLVTQRPGAGPTGERTVRAPMPGRVVSVHVEVGDRVEAGQGVVVVEAMKMQNELRAPRDGRVQAVKVQTGDSVAAGEPLVVVR